MKKFDVSLGNLTCVGYALYYPVPYLVIKETARRIILIDTGREKNRFVVPCRPVGKVLAFSGKKTGHCTRTFKKLKPAFREHFFQRKLRYIDPDSRHCIDNTPNLLTLFGLNEFLRAYKVPTKDFRTWLRRAYHDILAGKYDQLEKTCEAEIVDDIDLDDMDDDVDVVEYQEEQEMESSCTALVPIYEMEFDEGLVQTSNARELWAFMGVKSNFSHWVKRRLQECLAVKGRDFITVVKNNVVENQRVTTTVGNPIEYHITLDIAKHIAMLERTEKGRIVREYFIEVEKKWSRGEVNPRAERSDQNNTAVLVEAFMEGLTHLTKTILESNRDNTNAILQAIAMNRGQDYQVVKPLSHMTVLGYAKMLEIKIDLKSSQSIGKRATRLCNQRDLEVRSIQDERFETVNVYPIEILKEIFTDIYHGHINQPLTKVKPC